MSSENELFTPAIDPHTHLFPERLVSAIRDALTEEAGWEFDIPVERESIEEILREAGVDTYVALPYVHRPGMAAELNQWVCQQASESEMLLPFATVHPEDEDVETIVRQAFASGARGLKFHCPVQGVAPADPRIEPALEVAAEYDAPITYHGGTAPMFEDNPAVGPDVFQEALEAFPEVRMCCAHMGTYDVEEFVEFAREYDNAYLDTTFAMSTQAEQTMDFDPATIPDETFVELSESIMYGSDLPNIPYDYREERAELLGRDLPRETYRNLFYNTAREYLGLDER